MPAPPTFFTSPTGHASPTSPSAMQHSHWHQGQFSPQPSAADVVGSCPASSAPSSFAIDVDMLATASLQQQQQQYHHHQQYQWQQLQLQQQEQERILQEVIQEISGGLRPTTSDKILPHDQNYKRYENYMQRWRRHGEGATELAKTQQSLLLLLVMCERDGHGVR